MNRRSRHRITAAHEAPCGRIEQFGGLDMRRYHAGRIAAADRR